MGCAHWWGPYMCWSWIVPFLFMILMFALACRSLRRAGGRKTGSRAPSAWWPCGWWSHAGERAAHWRPETPTQILGQRYASGEITKEQYEQMKRDLEGSRPQARMGDK